jgi:hypothetical protein
MPWHLNFATGEAKEISDEESARMAMEFNKRCKIKDGVVYVDCDPPEDDEEQQGKA